MRFMIRWNSWVACLLLAAWGSAVLQAQTLTVLYTFGPTTYPGEGGVNANGANPTEGLLLSGTNLYGAATQGGPNAAGLIFSKSLTGTNYTILHVFGPLGYLDEAAGNYTLTNADGMDPSGVLALSGNTLFGFCSGGGTYGNGTVFSVTTTGSNFTVLHTFPLLLTNMLYGSPTVNNDGAWPSGLVLGDDVLYGTAKIGGTNGSGTVFRLTTNGDFVPLHSFTSGYLVNGADGANPSGGLFFTNNTLYGTASGGGANGAGVVFAMTNNGGWLLPLYAFPAISYLDNYVNSTGGNPYSRVIVAGNSLYGSAYVGGTNGDGTLFSIVNGTNFTLLHTFSAVSTNGTNVDGEQPVDDFLLAGDTLYGVASYAGAGGEGTIYELGTNGTDFKTRYNFTSLVGSTNTDGASPNGNLVLFDNALYGTTRLGGTNGNGTIFKLTLPSASTGLAIRSVNLAGRNLVINAVNGLAGDTCTVLMTTNLTQARAGWTPVATNLLTANGSFSVTLTNAVSPSVSRRFYFLKMF